MKKLLALLLSCSLLLCLLAGCGGGNDTPEPTDDGEETNQTDTPSAGGDVIKIGVFEPSSGENGAGGKQEILGMKYANTLVPTVEIDGKEYTIELVYADNASANDKATTAAQTLVSQGVSVVLGSYGSSVSIAASPTFADAGIPAIGVTCTNPQVTEGNTHYFRICFLDPFQGTVQASFAKEEFDAKTAYCLAELGNDYDVGLATYFKEAFEADGGKVIYETFPKGTADFTAYLTSAKNAGADVIFAPCSVSYATQIIDQAASQNLGMPLMAGDTWDNNKIVEAAQGKEIEVYVSTFYQEGGNTEFDEGFKAYLDGDSNALSENGGNNMISAVSAMGYDAYMVAVEAIKAANSADAKDINEALWTVTHAGVSGDIAFNETGDAIRDVAYIKMVNTTENIWDFVKVQTVQSEEE